MFATLRRRGRCAVAQTKAELDLARLLPPDREDVTGISAIEYGLCVIGNQTVAGVALAKRRAAGKKKRGVAVNDVQRALQAAQDALNAAQDAHDRAQDAVQRAKDTYNREHERNGRGADTADSEELAQRLRDGMIGPNSSAEELLRIRTVLLSRVP